jgi:anaerobic selenocysteine-containing dehydrogenase
MAMCNLIVNELGTIEASYLKAKTNAPYLIGPDGRYVFDKESGKPLVWDTKANTPRTFDIADSPDMALEGRFAVNGVACRPAFALLKDHLKKYTPEWGEQITTIPAQNLRKLANDFVREARIGSTIVIDGVTLPYRPVAAIAFRGVNGHMNSLYNFYSILLLNELVGALDVPGSCLGCLRGPVLQPDEDGTVKPGTPG